MSDEVVLVVEQLRRSVAGGIGTYIRGLLGGLDALGPDAPALALFASRPPTGDADPLAGLGHRLQRAPLPARLLLPAWRLGVAGVRTGAVTHAASLAAPPSRPPLAVTVHDLAWRALPAAFPPRGRRWHEAALRRAMREAAAFVVPSDPVAAALAEAGVAPGRIHVIAEGADHLPPPDWAGARRLLGRLGVRGPFLLSVATLEPRKNLLRLVRAYGAARAALPEPWPLVVLGPSGWGDAARALAAPPPGVVLGGRVDDGVLAGCYALARCCAYVPLLEGFGLPVVEAMAAGVPVVASPVPSAGEAALLVEPTDEEAIAAGLVAAASDEATRERLVAAGTAHVASLRWRTTAAAHVQLWRELRGAGRRPR
jgi:glycosyltransferase involved in cell wall biosynthesis